jgi:WD40 repeat protein
LAESLRAADRAGDDGLRHAAAANLESWRREACRLDAALEHPGDVTAAVFSPDGTRLATACVDGTVRLFDVNTGRLLVRKLPNAAEREIARISDGPNDPTHIQGLVFDPDGRALAAAYDDGTVRFWDVRTSMPIGEPLDCGAEITAVASSPDGKTLAIGSSKVLFWDWVERRPLGAPVAVDSRIDFLAYSPDGKLLAVGGNVPRLGWVQLLDLASGRTREVASPSEGRVNSVVFRRDGKSLLIAKAKVAQLWDVVAGRPIGPAMEHRETVNAVAISLDGKTALTGSGGQFDGPLPMSYMGGLDSGEARLWDAETGRPRGGPLLHRGFVTAVAFRPDGRGFVTAGEERTARLWSLPEGPSHARPLDAHGSPIRVACFSQDGRWIATASQPAHFSNGDPVVIWEARTGRRSREFPGLGWPIALSPEGRILAAADNRLGAAREAGDEMMGGTRLYDTSTGRPLGQRLAQDTPVNGLYFSPDGKRLISIGGAWMGADVRVWDVTTRRVLGRPFVRAGQESIVGIKAVAFRGGADPVVALYDEDREVRIYDAWTGQAVGAATGRPAGPVTAVAIAPDLGRLVTGGVDGRGRLWSTSLGRPLGQPIVHRGVITGAAFRPDGRMIATASEDATARLWDATSGWPIGPPLRHSGPVEAAAFRPDGRALLTISEGVATLWEVLSPTHADPDRWTDAVHLLSGMELDEFGATRVLEPKRWLELRDRAR